MTYQLLDSGDGQKLERVGSYKLIRSSPVSLYPKTNPSLWKNPDAEYKKNDQTYGQWIYHRPIPESFTIQFAGIEFKIRLTPFGHIGIFPEQKENWDRIRNLGKKKKDLEVLNLFAYSGGASLACLQAGMKVCHVDASKGMVDWARENAKLNRLEERPIRWIVEDVLKFLRREIKRSRSYQGFLLDPPSFGRGSKGEVWKIEEQLPELLGLLMELCQGKPSFVILSSHSQGFSALTMKRMLDGIIRSTGTYETTELSIPEESGKLYPAGSSVFFQT